MSDYRLLATDRGMIAAPNIWGAIRLSPLPEQRTSELLCGSRPRGYAVLNQRPFPSSPVNVVAEVNQGATAATTYLDGRRQYGTGLGLDIPSNPPKATATHGTLGRRSDGHHRFADLRPGGDNPSSR
jgi:hypothetical protein